MKTKILGASILNIDYFTHCAEAAIFGATLKDEVFEKLMLNSLIPGVEFDLLEGFKALAGKNTNERHFDEKLGFSVVQQLLLVIKQITLSEVKRMFEKILD